MYGHAYLMKEKVYLPHPRHARIQKTLILDLDETMIHCLDERELGMGIKPDITVKVPYLLDEEDGPCNMSSNVCFVDAEVVVRPYLRAALERLSKNF
jgi:hypothetical protein